MAAPALSPYPGPLMRVSFGFGLGISCACVRCGAERDIPDNSQRRLPAHGSGPEEGITVTADTRCRCGATRVRIRLEFDDDGDGEEEDPPDEGD